MRNLRWCASLLAACLCAAGATAAPDPDWPREHHVALGVRLGFMPPALAVAEVLARPVPHLALGLFGMAISHQNSIGGEVMVETASPGASTPYIQLAYLSYSEQAGRQEQSQLLYTTAGYTWKGARGEAQLGAGLFFFLSDELAPCPAGTFVCIGNVLPRILPTFDLGFRFSVL
jgi:hypothetical protein